MPNDLIEPTYVHRLDTSSPGVFVVRVNQGFSMQQLENFSRYIRDSISKFAEGSEVIVLGPEFEPVVMPDPETMRRLGWARIEEKGQ